MNCDSTSRGLRRRRRRYGAALVAIIALFAISLALFGLWAQNSIRMRQQLATRQLRWQAERLAEAGLARATARLYADAVFRDETWKLPADQLQDRHAAEVRIRVVPDENRGVSLLEATAVYPIEAARSAKVTKRVEFADKRREGES
jgi:hypothetical protein